LGVPFLLISWLLTYSLQFMKKMNRWIPLLSKLNGWLLIGLGFLLFTGQLQKISAWLSQYTFWEINF
jgi:cytochrome c-type biogenesis protein